MRLATFLPLAAVIAGGLAASSASGCSTSQGGPPTVNGLSTSALMDPAACSGCHKDHYSEWSGSMHAYAADDPVFLAMNKRGQRETKGALGSFCVNCHAPLAVRTGATKDGLNLDTVDPKLKGVTCFFCHSVESVSGSHDNPLAIAGDGTIRGEYADAVPNSAHRSIYSPLHDRDQADSAKLCGACHDIVTNHGANIERTFAEWNASVFSQLGVGSTCSQCHMDQSVTTVPIAQLPNLPQRRTHSHAFPGVDVALSPFPNAAEQKTKVAALLATTLQSALCVAPLGAQSSVVRVIVDNVAAGHGFPSGSAQDRRVWVELVATKGGQVIYQSGVVPDGQSPLTSADPDRWVLHDCLFDSAGNQVRNFWDAASYETNQLPGLTTFNPLDPGFYKTHIIQSFPAGQELIGGVPDKVTMRIRIQPIGLDVIDDLVATNDLDPSVRLNVQTMDVGVAEPLVWTAEAATSQYQDPLLGIVSCVTATNFNVATDKTPATPHVKCKLAP